MSANVALVKSIKVNFAGLPEGELRQMLKAHDLSRYSEEALVAAQEVLDERVRGLAAEPAPRAPEIELSPEQARAWADARLWRQVRLIGIWYYIFAGAWLIPAVVVLQSSRVGLIPSLALFIPVVLLWLVGFHLRRFSPIARGVALFLSILFLLSFPVGTLFGYYCFDKLTRGDYLFGEPVRV